MDCVAFVDESEPDQRFDPGTYILGATIVPIAVHQKLGNLLRTHLRSGQKKIHWHEESAEGRNRLISFVATLQLDHLLVIRTGDPSERSERRRRLCLQRLCSELVELDIERIVLESRGPADKLDRSLIDALRSKRLLTPRIRVDHLPGPSEPLLLLPDILCGAAAQSRRGNPVPLEALGRSVKIVGI